MSTLHFLCYFQQTCAGRCDCLYGHECLEIRRNGQAMCQDKRSICTQSTVSPTTRFDLFETCRGCIGFCVLSRQVPTYHCCDCPPPPPKRRCFPSTAKISLKNGKFVKMSQLQVADQVQIGTHI